MFLQISCYPCGGFLLRMKATCSKRMRRYVSLQCQPLFQLWPSLCHAMLPERCLMDKGPEEVDYFDQG